MKKLFDAADRYLKIADWKDMALLKFCLFSMGANITTLVTQMVKEITDQIFNATVANW